MILESRIKRPHSPAKHSLPARKHSFIWLPFCPKQISSLTAMNEKKAPSRAKRHLRVFFRERFEVWKNSLTENQKIEIKMGI